MNHPACEQSTIAGDVHLSDWFHPDRIYFYVLSGMKAATSNPIQS